MYLAGQVVTHKELEDAFKQSFLELPYPVSANRYWRRAGVRLYVSPEAKAYKEAAALAAKEAGLKVAEGPISLVIHLSPKNGICMDLDNCLKVAIDALNGVAYRDDKQIRKITAERLPADGVGGLRVWVMEMGGV